MTIVTFEVSASAFAALCALQQTVLDHGYAYALATNHVYKSFYMDDCLARADTNREALLYGPDGCAVADCTVLLAQSFESR